MRVINQILFVMKKNLFYLFALVCAMSLFTSCGSDDDDDNKVEPYGTYSGNLSVVLTTQAGAQDPITSKESVQLIKGSSDNKFSFLLKNFMLQMGGIATGIGNINIENVDLVSAGGNKYTFSKSIPELQITAGDKEGVAVWLGPTLGKIPVDLSGTIEGNKVTVVINIPSFMSMDIAVNFTGTK